MISIIHPTRRPEEAYKTMIAWLSKADEPNNLQYIFSLDAGDTRTEHFLTLPQTDGYNVFISDSKNAIQAINNAAENCTGDILLVTSDDFDCPDHWDTLLLQALEGKSDFCAKTKDGLQPTLITLPIMDRIYYERYGYVYHPDFEHLHSDEELTCVALMTGKYLKLDILFPHNHYTTGKFKKDALSVKNDNTWSQGAATLERHAKNNFGIENPAMERKDIKWR
ncbi:MAG TPA: hypothetical protein VHA52_04575 [Candidatus Babeliaceae bacterium]|nr:hypothetical protein [Candidatus Babeliaceae bacterium]